MIKTTITDCINIASRPFSVESFADRFNRTFDGIEGRLDVIKTLGTGD